MITKERLQELLDYNPDTGLFTWKVYRSRGIGEGSTAGYTRPDGYIFISVEGKDYAAHRLVWLYINGRFPPQQMDHINGNPSDNRLLNLREVSVRENNRNRKLGVNNTSGTMGVSSCGNGWRAHVKVDGAQINLGVYDTIDEASAARFGALVILNFHPNHGEIRSYDRAPN